jgi:hypothetical protein
MLKFDKAIEMQEQRRATRSVDSQYGGWDTTQALEFVLDRINVARFRLRGPLSRAADKQGIDDLLEAAADECIWAMKGVERLSEYEAKAERATHETRPTTEDTDG